MSTLIITPYLGWRWQFNQFLMQEFMRESYIPRSSSSSNLLILFHVHFPISKWLIAAPAFVSAFLLAWRARSATCISSLEFARGTFPKKKWRRAVSKPRPLAWFWRSALAHYSTMPSWTKLSWWRIQLWGAAITNRVSCFSCYLGPTFFIW